MAKELGNIILISYSCLWFIFLLWYKSKNQRFTLGYFLIALYCILSLLTIYVFNSEFRPLYYEPDVQIFPLIYLFGIMFVTFLPIIQLHEDKLLYLRIPEEATNNYICSFFGMFSLFEIIIMLPEIREGMIIMMSSNADSITDLYVDMTHSRMEKVGGGSGLISIIGVISNLSLLIGPLIFYQYLLQKNRSCFVMFLTTLTLIQGFLTGIAEASRCKIAASVFVLTLLFFFFKPFLERKLVVKLKKISLIIGGVIVSLLLIITFARVASVNKVSSTFNIARYLGGSTLVFDNYCLDAGGDRGGYKTIPLVNSLLGEKEMNESESRFKFSYMKIDNSRFCTYVGDYVLDYGPILGAFVLIVISCLFLILLRHNHGLSYSQVIYVYMVTRFCSAYYQAAFTGIGGNIAILFFFILAFSFSNQILKSQIIYRKQN